MSMVQLAVAALSTNERLWAGGAAVADNMSDASSVITDDGIEERGAGASAVLQSGSPMCLQLRYNLLRLLRTQYGLKQLCVLVLHR